MSYALVTLFLYLYHYVPWVFCRPLAAVPLFSVFMLASASRSIAFYLLSALLAFLLLMEAPGNASAGILHEHVSVIYGEALQDSTQKEGRQSGFRMAANAAGTPDGAVFSASGTLYAAADSSDVRYGDRIAIHGVFSGPVFAAYSIHEYGSSRMHGFRNAAADLVRSLLRRHGDAGELGMRLLLGYGEMGFFGLSSDASSAGLMHVLALSGMHLSIISSFLSYALFFLPSKAKHRIIDAFLVFFAFLSGWRPSLVRALIFRFMMQWTHDRDASFMLSFLILQIIFPYSCTDLGAIYSFISLAGIFMLSEPMDRSIRRILPLPKSLSLSVSASISALVFSIPLTLDTFGSYQLGTVLSSFPASILISLYMCLSVIALIFPPSGILLQYAYDAAELLFSISASFPQSTDYGGYFALAAIALLLIAYDIPYRISSVGYVEPELQQHK